MHSTEYESSTTIRTIDHGSKTIPTVDDAPTLCKKITVSNTVVTDLLESYDLANKDAHQACCTVRMKIFI